MQESDIAPKLADDDSPVSIYARSDRRAARPAHAQGADCHVEHH